MTDAKRIVIASPEPIASVINWMYPTNECSIEIRPCCVRVIDGLLIGFDFGSHEWVVKQDKCVGQDYTGEWVEVARISGNAPGWIDT